MEQEQTLTQRTADWTLLSSQLETLQQTKMESVDDSEGLQKKNLELSFRLFQPVTLRNLNEQLSERVKVLEAQLREQNDKAAGQS